MSLSPRLPAVPILCLALALCAPRPAAASCGEELSIPHAFRVGLSLNVLLPSSLPDFDRNAVAYGLLVGVPIGPGSLLAGGSYGTGDGGLAAYILETNYRLWLQTPYLTPYVQVGAHYLNWRSNGRNHDGFGGNAGLGLVISLERNFEITMGLQGYLRARSVVSFGGGFNFRL